MELEEKMELVKRNTEEIVKEEELKETLEEKENPRVYVGYEISGPVHLGTWLSLRKLLDLQKAGFDVVVLFADLHTYLNRKGDQEWIKKMSEYWKATFKACGLDAEYVMGTSFQESDEYFHDLLRMSLEVTINRGVRSMNEVAKDEENPYVSQILYPLMQALDIHYLDLDLAVGGIEQRRIHMLAREYMPKIGYDKPTCLHHPLMLALTGDEKMSSSDPKTMFPLHADPDTIRERIKEAYCPGGQVEDNPVIQIAKFHIFGADNNLEIERKDEYGGNLTLDSLEELKEVYSSGDLHPLDLKEAVADSVIEQLKPVRERFKEEPELLDPLEKC